MSHTSIYVILRYFDDSIKKSRRLYKEDQKQKKKKTVIKIRTLAKSSKKKRVKYTR